MIRRSRRALAFDAWGANADRVDAFAATLRALPRHEERLKVTFRTPGHEQIDRENLLAEEIAAVARRLVGPGTQFSIFLTARVPSGRWSDIVIRCEDEQHGLCTVHLCSWELYPERVPLAVLVGPRSAAVDAAASALATQE